MKPRPSDFSGGKFARGGGGGIPSFKISPSRIGTQQQSLDLALGIDSVDKLLDAFDEREHDLNTKQGAGSI